LTESIENEDEDDDGRSKLKASQCTNANVCFHSEYGVKHCDLCEYLKDDNDWETGDGVCSD
jgi:hypothetical protein